MKQKRRTKCISQDNCTSRYFLDCQGVPTTRMANRPGCGHIEVAETVLGRIEPGCDVYAQMFDLRFVRVLESDTELLVDAPRGLTKQQQRFLDAKCAEGKRLILNDERFVQGRGRRT